MYCILQNPTLNMSNQVVKKQTYLPGLSKEKGKPSDNFSFNMTKHFKPKDSSTNYVPRKRKTTGVDLPKKKKLRLAEESVVLKLKKRNSGNWQLRQYKSPLGRIKLKKEIW